MKKLTILMGKTFSGKSTFINKNKNFTVVKTHTTRPIRPTESGNEYHFESEDSLKNRKTIALRDYNTIYGKWYYWVEEEDFINLSNSILILDYIGAKELYNYIKEKNLDINLNIKYLNINNDVLMDRIKFSDRGKTEDSLESFRRLQFDIEDFKDIDNLLSKYKTDAEVVDLSFFFEQNML